MLQEAKQKCIMDMLPIQDILNQWVASFKGGFCIKSPAPLNFLHSLLVSLSISWQRIGSKQLHINYLYCMLPSWMFSTSTSHNYQNLVTERTMCIKFYLLVHVHVHYQNYLKDIWKPVYILCKLVNKCWNAEKGYLKRNHLCWLVVLSQCLWDF